MEQSVARRFKADQELRRACDESTLAGDLLLKAEGEELERVNQYADELMKKEYRLHHPLLEAAMVTPLKEWAYYLQPRGRNRCP